MAVQQGWDDPVAQQLLDQLRRAHGAIRVRDLQPTRTQRRRIAALVAGGDLCLDRGVIFLQDVSPAVVIARICGGLLTCASAVKAMGLPVPGWQWRGVHVAVPSGARPARVQATLHHDNRLARPDPYGWPCMPVAEALACYLCCDDDPLMPISAVDAALRQKLVSREEVKACLAGRRNAERARQRLALASERARSPLETCARLDLVQAGLSYRDGVVIDGVGEVDFVVEGFIVVETDGREFHDDPLSFERDRRRDRALAVRGYLAMRFTYDDVRTHQVVPDVAVVLARHGRLPLSVGVTIPGDCGGGRQGWA